MQLGIATPSQVGLELESNKRGEKNAIQMKAEFPQAPKIGNSGPAGVSGQGRPKTSKDSKKRKTKNFAPQTGASLALWANEAQDKISEIVNPMLLEFYKKDNLRKLSAQESKELDTFKTKILLNIQPNCKIDENCVNLAIAKVNTKETSEAINGLNFWIKQISNELNKSINTDENKIIKSSFYSAINNRA